MTGFKRIVQPGHIVYRGLRFSGDSLVKTQVIGRFLARETNPAPGADTRVTVGNYTFALEERRLQRDAGVRVCREAAP